MLGKIQKKYQKNIQVERLQKPEGGPERGHRLAKRPAGAARGVAAPSGCLGQGGPPLRSSFGIYVAPKTETLE